MRTSSDASRNRMRTRAPVDRRASRAAGSASRYSSRGPVPTTSATRSVVDPGARTNSATLPMRAGGRLSMTNHPRSSKVLAAFDRPAPDNPVISRNSVIAAPRLRPCLRSGDDSRPIRPSIVTRTEGGEQEQEARDGRRFLVLLGSGQEAGWRSRLLHLLDEEAGG